MQILGIDPGPANSTYVLAEFSARSLLDTGISICGVSELGNEDMLEKLRNTADAIVVCEKIACFGMAVGKEVFETCEWIGMFRLRLRDSGVNLEMLTRMQCKMNLCQSARAKDANIRQALIDRYGEVGKRSAPGPLFGIASHAWSALAVAATWHDLALERAKQSARETRLVTELTQPYSRPSCETAAGGNL